MNPSRWRRAEELFGRLVEMPQEVRQGVLRTECGEDHELFEAVNSLLEADEQSRALIDDAPVSEFRQALDAEVGKRWLGRSLGSYRLLEKIGQGGMGQVFLAEREDQAFDKKVAIKVMSSVTQTALERFHRERQILANLEHEGIARLLDGGTTPDGLPYLVMELVDGVPLTQFCDARNSNLEERLHLFLQICDAVQFAHRNLVVHRDLKPSNILVNSEGRPKLLDFGIAKLLDHSDRAASQTLANDRMLTPDYASPEQLHGSMITTASDVYSLGILLHQILTGALPERKSRPSSEPPSPGTVGGLPRPPSAVAMDRSRLSPSGVPSSMAPPSGPATSPPIPPRRLQGDLDNIVLKALNPEPGGRYSSVERLAADLTNHLAGLPVEAQPPRFLYRASKFIRRNAVGVTVAAAIMALLVTFSTFTLLQARNLQKERDVSTQALEFLVHAFRGADPQINLGQEATARDVLQRGAEGLAQERGPASEFRAVLSRTLGQVYRNLGSPEEGKVWLEEAAALETELHGPESEHLGLVLLDLADVLLQTVDYNQAEATIQQALPLIPEHRATARVQALRTLGEVKAALNQWRESAEVHEDALALARNTFQQSDPELVDSLAAAAQAARRLRDFERTRELLEEGLRIQELHRPGDSRVTSRLLAGSGGAFMRAGDFDQGRVAIRQALEMNRRIYGSEHSIVAASLGSLAQLEKHAGNPSLAADLFAQSLAIFEGTLGPDHPQTVGARYEFALFVHHELEDPARAEPMYRSSVESYETVEGSENHSNLAFLLADHGSALNDLGRYAEAEPPWRRSLEIRLKRGVGATKTGAQVRLGLADALVGQGKDSLAEIQYQEAWKVLMEKEGIEDAETRRAGEGLMAVYQRTQQLEAAAEIEELLTSSP
ncbi:MAG: tetratricopeptide repeat protein [Deltaproteobacteria bacterium]|nr:tetratricopeptide repeat protein [Deltaproteobacteria bacterium]